MGVAAENNSSIIGLKKTEGAKMETSVKFAALIAEKAISDNKKSSDVTASISKKPCLCAPTTHPGSFRCRLHRGTSSSSIIIIKKTTKTKNPGLSRFARDVSLESTTHDPLIKPQYNSE